ncbi:MAG: hypothetical protein ACOYD0_00670 [Candidatus Nanopelagicales bacterium]
MAADAAFWFVVSLPWMVLAVVASRGSTSVLGLAEVPIAVMLFSATSLAGWS